jgi:phage-related protein
MEWEILYYHEGNRSPVRDFIDTLPPKTKAKVLRNLLLLSEFGLELGWPLVSNVDRNIWELRTVYQGNQYRLLFSLVPEKTFLVLHGFQKKSAKLPERELEIARKRLKRYLLSREGGK